MKNIIIICGPTATGKTDLALSLAKQYDGELVSADSRQIYRGMDIGTGKDLKSKKTIDSMQLSVIYGTRHFHLVPYDMDGIPLWMCDVVNPDEEFTVSHYYHLTMKVIDEIVRRGKVPIVVGGTGLYIRSIIEPFGTEGIAPDETLRKRFLNAPLSVLQEMVKTENADIWKTMNESDRSNPRRLIRKLEINHSQIPIQKPVKKEIEYVMIGLTAPQTVLYEKIDTRVVKRMQQGLLAEIQNLLSQGFDWHLRSFDALGYRQWRQWFENPYMQTQDMKDKGVGAWKNAEHAYARRQLTWFKKEKSIHWFDISLPGSVKNAMTTAITWYNNHR
jgi:tRNA dimethylallyltransferase